MKTNNIKFHNPKMQQRYDLWKVKQIKGYSRLELIINSIKAYLLVVRNALMRRPIVAYCHFSKGISFSPNIARNLVIANSHFELQD